MTGTATFWIALYAACLSTIVAVWNIYVGRRDRACLRVRVILGRITPDPKTLLILTMTNTGRRPLTVVGWYGTTTKTPKGGGFVVATSGLPLELKESARHHEVCVEWRPVLQAGLTGMHVSDTTGRAWRVSRRNLKALRRQWEQKQSKTGAPAED